MNASDPQESPAPHHRRPWFVASLAGSLGCGLISMSLALAVVLGEHPSVLTIPASALPTFDEEMLALETPASPDAPDGSTQLRVAPGSNQRNIVIVDSQRQTQTITVESKGETRIVARASQRSIE